MSRRLGRSVTLWVAASYEALTARIKARHFEFAWLPPATFAETDEHVRRLATLVRSKSSGYSAALLRRIGTGITAQTMAGRRAAWVSRQSSAGYLLPLQELARQGCAEESFTSTFTGSYQSALQALLDGEADVASIYAGDGTQAEIRAAIAALIPDADRAVEPFAVSIQTTASDAIAVRANLDPIVTAALANALTALSRSSSGARMCSTLFDSRGFDIAPEFASALRVGTRVRNTRFAMIRLNGSGVVVSADSCSGQLFGQSAQSVTGRKLADILGAEAASISAIADDAHRRQQEVPLRTRLDDGGSPEWFEVTAVPDPGSDVTTLLLTRADEAAEVEEELLSLASRPLLDTTAHFEVAVDGAILTANRAACDLLPGLLDGAGTHPLVADVLQRAEATGDGRHEIEVDGRALLVTHQKMPQGSGRPFLRISATDITKLRSMEKRLQKAEQLASLGTLAAGVAHELNNPLAFTLSNLQFAIEELADAAATNVAATGEVRQALNEAKEGAERAIRIVSDMKTLTRANETEDDGCDARAVVLAAVKTMPKASLEKVAVRIDGELAVPVAGNRDRLHQVFVNLIQNALDAMTPRPGGKAELHIGFRATGDDQVAISVSDTGAGVPAAVLPRVFDPFFTTKPIGVGTGLGLPICYSIVSAIGGDITVRSTVGVGTCVEVLLPVHRREARISPGGSDHARSSYHR